MKFPLLVLLAAGALSAPRFEFNNLQATIGAGESKCDDLRRLNDHATTMYDYEGETVNTIQGSTTHSTGMRMRGKIYFHPQGACTFSMQINNAELLVKSKNSQAFTRAAESAKFARELEARTILFQTSGGKINKLFPRAGEPLHVLNIKRGILSTMQLGKTTTEEEVDVNGRCKVSVIEQGDMLIKSKNLSECSERAHNELGIQTSTLENNQLPVNPLNSTSQCFVFTKNEQIQDVECLESHIFRPFSAGYSKTAGAMTIIKQTMKYIGEKGGSVRSKLEIESMGEGVSLAYEHETETLKPDNSIIARIDTIMTKLVTGKSNMGARQDSAHEFTQLVTLLRKLDDKRMRPVMEKYFECDRSGMCAKSQTDLKGVYRQYFLDALTYCGTSTCVSTVRDIIIKDELTGESMNLFLQGVALVGKPTKAMIRDVKEIATSKPSRQAYLTLGMLMYRYCSANEEQCAYGKTNPVTHAELFLEDKLSNSCSENNLDRVEEILMSIKAIGNAGRPSRAAGTLISCAKTASHQNITTAALEALRRMPCNEAVNVRLHEFLENVNLDSEKRIQAYIALMRCPNRESMKRIVKHLDREQSNQVASFVSSHLRNVNESSDPRHKITQEILAVVLKGRAIREPSLSMTRFSKAFEASVYSKYMRSGASVDSHLIYHQDSYIPKRALINVTANVLDVPVHVFEMAARVEGVETLIEDLFGKGGYLADNTVVKIFDYTFTKEDRAKLRSKRGFGNVKSNIDYLHEKVNKQRVQPSGSLSMKIMGHEMRVISYDDIFWAVDKIDNMNVIDLLLKVARGGKKTFTKSIMFLEMTHSVPTGLGLPIKLALKGSAVGSLELNGKFDIRNMFWGPSNMEIKGFVRPSAVVEVSGQMGVHSHYIDTGVFVNSSMFTSQMMKGSVSYQQGKLFKINIDAPEEPIEFFNISSTPFMFVNEDIKLIEGQSRKVSPDFCLNSKMILGLGLCTSMSVPVAFRDYEAPYFPLSGPAHFGMKIVKADPKLTTYEMSVSMQKKEILDGNQWTGMIRVGTPGASYSRGFSGMIRYQQTDKVRRLIVGEFKDKKSAELVVEYHNNTNRFEVNFINNLLTQKVMRTRFLYFNESADGYKTTGVLASASYDWYKFEHVTEFTREEDMYSVHSKTIYWPEKFLSAQAFFKPSSKDLTIKLEANQINQAVVMNGRYVKTSDEKGLNFTVKHLQSERKSTVYFGMTNSQDVKRVIANMTCFSGRYFEASLGHYKTERFNEVKFAVVAAGKTASVYVLYNKMSVDIGANVQGKTFGIAIAKYTEKSGNGARVCATVYGNNKQPVEVCGLYKSMDGAKNLMWTVRVLKKTAAISAVYTNAEGRRAVTTKVIYNKKELIQNVMSFTYKSLCRMELMSTTKVGEKSVSARVFTERQANSDIAFGVEANGFKKMVKLQGTYSRQASEVSTTYSVKVEAWVNKKLPVNYVASLIYGKPEVGVVSTLSIKEYQMIYSLNWKVHNSQRMSTKYFGIRKKDYVIFSTAFTNTLSLTNAEKFFKNEMTVTIADKPFTYGWDVTYSDRSTASRTAHGITFGLNYAQGRRSAVVITFANSETSTDLIADVMYLPGKRVTHLISYDKEGRQLDVSIEFLPRMFVKLVGRLDKINGWRLTTDLKLEWSNYNRVFTWVAAYVDRNDIQGLSFKYLAYNREFFMGSEYNKKTKTAIFTVSALGRTMRVAGYWLKEKKVMGLRLFTESKQGNQIIPREIIEAVVSYSNIQLAFELKTSTKSFVKTIAVFYKKAGFASFEIVAMKKSLMKIVGEVKKSQYLALSRLFVLGKERFQAVAKYNKRQRTVFLTFDALKKNWNVVFSGQWDPKRREVTVSTQLLGRVAGFKGRFCPWRYVAGWTVFYQKHQAGWSAYYDTKNHAVVYNVTLSPRLSAQIVAQIIEDRIVSVTLQRKFGLKIVNEAVFKYELNSATSNLVFKWNKDTTGAIRDMIVPVVKRAISNATDFFKKMSNHFSTTGRKVSIEVARNVTSQILRLINEADKRFDEIDFAGLKEKSGELIVETLKRAAALTNKGLKMTSKALTKVHEKMPEIMEKTREIARRSVEVSKVAMEEAKRVAKIAYIVAKNITESGIPVAKTAVKLAKEFKIRGKTMEEIVAQAQVMVEKFTKTWKKNLSEKLIQLKKDIVKYVVDMPVPYRKERLGELVKIYVQKVKEMRANFNLEEKTRQLTRDILEYEIQGKSVKVHYDEALKSFKTLPEDMKVKIFKYIKDTRIYAKKVKKVLRRINSFFQPIVRCATKCQASIDKHFRPLFVDASKEVKSIVKSEFTKIYTPTRQRITELIEILERFVTPLLKPIKPLYTKMRDQLRSLRVAEVEIGSFLDAILASYKTELEAKLNEIKSKVTTETERVVKYVKSIAKMTPEQITESLIDGSLEYSKDAVKYAKSVYKNREEIIKRWRAEADKVIADVKGVYAIMTSKPVEDIIHLGFQTLGDRLIATMKEMVKVVDQFSAMEIVKPLEQAWKDMDIFNHLEKYGVNVDVLKAIAAAKNVNLTETLFASLNAAKAKIMKAYGIAEMRYLNAYRTGEKVYRYLRAIPKREWEDFYGEVEAFVMKNQVDVYEVAQRIFAIAKARMMQTVDALKQMKQTYGRYIAYYNKPAMKLYNDVKRRAELVVAENKQDCSIVMNMYKDLVVGIAKERYAIVKAYGEKVYNKYYNSLVAFYKKHEDKTWEEIGENAYEIGKKNYDVAYRKAEKKIEELRIVAKKVAAVAKELYANATALTTRYVELAKEKYQTKIRPEALKIYGKLLKKYELAVEQYNKYYAIYYKKTMEMYKKMYATALNVYETNKRLSIRQLYKKTVATVNSKVMEQMEKMKTQIKELKAVAKTRYSNVFAKAVEMKNKFNTDVLPIVLEEAESIFNQTLKASVILANETVKAYTPHARIVKAHVLNCYATCKIAADKYYKKGAVYAAKYYEMTKEKSMVLYKQGLEKATEQVKKFIEYLKQTVEKVKNCPRYQKVMNHEMTVKTIKYLKKMVEAMKVKIAELKVKMNELKQHPKVLEFKQKIEEVREKLMAMKDDARVLRLLNVLKQIKKSAVFTAKKLAAKAMPHLEVVRINIAKISPYLKTHSVMFRRVPTICFWTNVGHVKSIIMTARDYDWKSIDVKQIALELINDVTDEETKEAFETLKTKSKELYAKYYAKAQAAPDMIKEKATKLYNEQIEKLKGHVNFVKEQWKRCPMYPIVNHEIWGDIVDEVKNHEIVTGVKSLAVQAREMLKKYKVVMAAKIQKCLSAKRDALKAKIDNIIAKYNSFLDETTLEDIVIKMQDTYAVAKTKINARKEKMVAEIKKAYVVAKERYEVYREKAVVIGKKYYAKVDKIWKEKYPVVVRRATAEYEKALKKVNRMIKDVVKYSKEMKTKTIAKTLKLWNESCLKRHLITLKKMSIAETVAEIKMLPLRANRLYEKARGMMKVKLEELKAKYNVHLRARVEKIKNIVKAIAHEMNATGIFIYKYYDLEGNMLKLKEFSVAQMKNGIATINATVNATVSAIKKSVREVLPKIPGKIRSFAKDFAKKSLKSVHTSLVYLDNVDLKPYMEKAKSRVAKLREYVPDMKKYVVLDTKEGQLMFVIHHMRPVEPRFTYHIKKIDTTVRREVAKISRKTVAMTKRMMDFIRNKTAEVRQDINDSFIAHSKLGRHLKTRVVAVSTEVWKKSADWKTTIYKTAGVVKSTVKDYALDAMNKGKQVSKDVFNFANNAVVDISYSNGLEQVFEKTRTYSKLAVENIKAELKPVYELAKKHGKDMYKKMFMQYLRVVYKVKPYYIIVKTATKEWRNGAEFRQAFKIVEAQLRKAYRTLYDGLKKKTTELKESAMNMLNEDDMKIVDEYLASHKMILGKYAKRVYRTYKFSKMRVMSGMMMAKRMIKRQLYLNTPKCPYTATAMIFGKNHVMTFDKKFYDVPKFPKKQCTYLLARDFHSGNLTVMSQQESIIVQTPDIEVSIHQDGSVVSTVKVSRSGELYKKIVTGLPVESQTSSCIRMRNSIRCEFEQGLKLYCNVKHFLCSIELSSKLYGKTQGLLGTNNHEKYDDFKLPSNKITRSVNEFVNSWLVTRNGECMIKEENNEAPLCNKAPSEKCFEIFQSEKSPLAASFKKIDPLPFLKACLADTADCENTEPSLTSHCNATKAYRVALRAQGLPTPKISDCVTYTMESGKIVRKGEEWVQPLKNYVDVVVMISERKAVRKMRRTIATMIYYVNKGLEKKGFNTRYALIGFGGNGVHEKPHYHTRRGQYFRNAADMSSLIKELPYTGESSNSNDVFAAINLASAMQMRPAARKVFMMFNFDQPKTCFFGAGMAAAELKRKANATLLVFDNFDFKSYGKSRVIGQTASRVYLSPDFQAVPMSDYEMPQSAFTELARESNGGLFLNKFKPAEMKVMVTAVSDALIEPVTQNKLQCQKCKLSWKVQCKTTDRMTC
eukprot:gene8123-8993_t